MATLIKQTEVPPLERPDRTWLYSLGFDSLTLDQVMQEIERACKDRNPLQIITANVQFIRLASVDPEFAAIVHRAGLVTVDGRIVLWLTHLLGVPPPQQITGHDIFRECVTMSAARDLRIFLLGGGPGVAIEAVRRLKEKHPTLQIDGTDHGQFNSQGIPEREEELLDRLRRFRPDIIFVSLGAPKQDKWIARSLGKLEIPIGVGVGNVIDTVACKVPRIPTWLHHMGLEAFYRVATNPGRYAKRYLVHGIPMVFVLFWYCLGRRLRLIRNN